MQCCSLNAQGYAEMGGKNQLTMFIPPQTVFKKISYQNP